MAFFPTNFMLQASHEDAPHSLSSFLPLPPVSSCTTTHDHHFHGVGSFLGKRSTAFGGTSSGQASDNNIIGEEDSLSDEGLVGGEKKRRLKMEQVRTLERNFELGNKLDPERKMQLATSLGLQPRQIAIWFQNRRARWKTKQLEKDYDVLKSQFEAIKAQNDSLLSQNHKLHAQIMALKKKEATEVNMKETTQGCCSENSCDNISTTPPPLELDSPLSSHPNPNLSISHQNHHHHLHGHKIDAISVKEESLCNMFVSIQDQSGFWPWSG